MHTLPQTEENLPLTGTKRVTYIGGEGHSIPADPLRQHPAPKACLGSVPDWCPDPRGESQPHDGLLRRESTQHELSRGFLLCPPVGGSAGGRLPGTRAPWGPDLVLTRCLGSRSRLGSPCAGGRRVCTATLDDNVPSWKWVQNCTGNLEASLKKLKITIIHGIELLMRGFLMIQITNIKTMLYFHLVLITFITNLHVSSILSYR